MKLVIEKEAAQQLLNYIQTKPFREVFQLVGILTSLKPLEHTEAEEKAPCTMHGTMDS